MLWFGGCWRCRDRRRHPLFLIFLEQAPHGVRWLRAACDPIFRTIYFQRAVMPGFFRIVRADDLDEPPLAWAATVGDDYFVIRPILRPFSA